jgi:hypothetical protein
MVGGRAECVKKKGVLIVRRRRGSCVARTKQNLAVVLCIASATTEYYDPFLPVSSKIRMRKIQRCVVIMSNIPSYQVVSRPPKKENNNKKCSTSQMGIRSVKEASRELSREQV